MSINGRQRRRERGDSEVVDYIVDNKRTPCPITSTKITDMYEKDRHSYID